MTIHFILKYFVAMMLTKSGVGSTLLHEVFTTPELIWEFLFKNIIKLKPDKKIHQFLAIGQDFHIKYLSY